MMNKLILILLMFLVPGLTQAQWLTADSLQTSVLRRLGHDDTTRFHGTDLLDYLNEGQIRVAVDCGAYRKMDTIGTTANQAIYAANADAIEGWPIEILSYHVEYPEKWRGLIGPITPAAMTEEGLTREKYFTGYVHAGQIIVYPAPPAGQGKLYILYRAFPPPLTAAADTCLIPAVDRPGIISYAAYVAAKAGLWLDRAREEKAEYDRHVRERQRDMKAVGQ